MTSDRRETGNATIEYVGITALVATLVLAVLLAAGAAGVDVAGAFRNAVCGVLGMDCDVTDGELSAQRMPEQCVVATNLMAGEGSVDVAVVTLGGGASMLMTRLSDGTYTVTLFNEGKAQASTGVGVGGFVDTGKGTVGFGAAASVGGGVVFGEGMVWTGLSESQARSIVDDLSPAVKAAPAGPFKNLLRNAWELLDGQDELRQPDQVYVEGGLGGDAGAQVAFGTAGGSATAKATAVLGYSVDRVKDRHTVYVKAGITADGSAGVLFGPGASTGLGLDGIVSVTVDDDGNPLSLAYSGSVGAELAGQLGQLDGQGTNDVFAELARQYGGDTGAGGGTMTQVKMTLDLTNDRNAAAALAFLREAGVSSVGGKPLVNPGTIAAGADLAQRIRDTGTVTVVDYDVASSKYGAGAQAKAGLQLGASSGMSWTSATARQARYWSGDRFLDLPNCVA